MTEPPIPIEFDTTRGAVVATPLGEIDLAVADDVRARLSAAAQEAGASCLVVDLGRVSYIDSAGVELLFRLRVELEDAEVDVVVVAPPGTRAARLLSIVGLEAVGELRESLADALELCARRATG